MPVWHLVPFQQPATHPCALLLVEALGNVMYAKHGGFVEGAEMFDSGRLAVEGPEMSKTQEKEKSQKSTVEHGIHVCLADYPSLWRPRLVRFP